MLTVAGCSTTAEPVARPSPQVDKERQREHLIADCMKRRGFKYIPFITRQDALTEVQARRMAGDYSAMHAFRRKYGLQVFAAFVYPFDKDAGGSAAMIENPNDAITTALSGTQGVAYNADLDTCYAMAVKETTGKSVRDFTDLYTKFGDAYMAALERELRSYPRVTKLTADYAACLRARGYTVKSESPTDIDRVVARVYTGQLHRIGREQWGKPDSKENFYPTLTAAQAMPYFRREIDAALEDLECGREFFPVVLPVQTMVDQRLAMEWGLA
ncbi:hypothetical protein OIE66_01910 [Nonomuraea sp. NBC_01738]|uniref:hypothetical protein n=1 Tax=Nonomuraea sp. NBC_01738 TaxID=2976003 RepID=UPI002E166076|nr:hypothetical protein OIE66_01910 [Nonomuraea sp. NBC_01738]